MIMNKFSSKYYKKLLILIFLNIHSDLVIGLSTDKDQPIELSSNTAVRNEKGGFTIYSGNVVLNQGSLSIRAEKLKVFHVSGAATRIVASGAPANLNQKPSADKDIVKAAAFEMIYERSSNLVILKKQAELKQANSLVKGDRITYSISEGKVIAESNASNAESRVNVVLPRDLLKGDKE